MTMILKLRMLSDEDDNFLRDYELPYTLNLLDFHRFICNDLGYEAGNVTSFFLADENWEKIREFTAADMGHDGAENAPIPMEHVTLGQLLHKNRDRLIYVFDMFGDRALYLEVTGADKEQQTFDYPRVALAHGEAPNQFDPELSTPNKSIFEEAMDDFSDYGGDDDYDDEY